ncbi:DUF3631 domain-containing protein [Pseudonocardia sp. ICBG601]|uniref:DUF3631 domain-containing protein n=1 Tax=Pseudonocardia sp. ICBG601 TaxID=2846759 RepID=UPI0027E32CAF|nr:DUF3631 domain-containing protein [Pseudonocardia sp. ICBG601]
MLEVAQYLVRRPEMTISATTAAIFRMLADGPVTLLFDEIDAVFSPKGGGNNEDLRGLLNSGYKRSATVSRCVGDASRMKVERFPVFAPVALAGIAGAMPATITTRAITVHMRRRAPHERAEAFRERRVEAEAQPLREQLAAWLDRVGEEHLVGAEPVMPEQVTDRAAEVWEPLLAIADLAGGHWPDTARAAAVHFVGQAVETGTSVGTRLLADLRALFVAHETDRMATSDIIGRLCADDEAGWSDLDGRPLDGRRMARELARYGVRPGSIRIGGHVAKGYTIAGALSDAFRPLPARRHRGRPVRSGYVGYSGYTAGQRRNRSRRCNRYSGYTPCRALGRGTAGRHRCNRCSGYTPVVGYSPDQACNRCNRCNRL